MLALFAALLAAGPPAAAAEVDSPTPAEAPPRRGAPALAGASLSFAFEPRFGTYQAVDTTLETYGFTPVGSPWLITYGLRGRFWRKDGWMLGGSMNFGFALNAIESNPVPTTSTLIETMFSAGHQLGLGFDVTLDVGFASHTLTVGSAAQGGALVYMGPAIQPRIGWVVPISPAFLRVSVGYGASFPVGLPHDQPLWEAPFSRPAIHTLLLAFESGFGQGIPRWPSGKGER